MNNIQVTSMAETKALLDKAAIALSAAAEACTAAAAAITALSNANANANIGASKSSANQSSVAQPSMTTLSGMLTAASSSVITIEDDILKLLPTVPSELQANSRPSNVVTTRTAPTPFISLPPRRLYGVGFGVTRPVRHVPDGRMMLPLDVGDFAIEGLVATGSKFTFLDKDMADEMGLAYSLIPRLKDWDLPPYYLKPGYAVEYFLMDNPIKVFCNGRHFRHQFYVVRLKETGCVFGTDLFKRVGLYFGWTSGGGSEGNVNQKIVSNNRSDDKDVEPKRNSDRDTSGSASESERAHRHSPYNQYNPHHGRNRRRGRRCLARRGRK
ncbi:hypothetical protein BGW41_004757 [Actinomortierella wolfii]|nr:hypothetical protein BGW41_004757 [Actinomortierella wolfii]